MAAKEMQREPDEEMKNLSMCFSRDHFRYVGGVEFYQQESSFGSVSSRTDTTMNGTEHRLRMAHDLDGDETDCELSLHANGATIGLRGVVNDGEVYSRNLLSMSHDDARELAEMILEEVGDK